VINANKMRKVCRPFRIILGTALIIAGVVTGIYWFYLGIIPLIAGIVDFCPMCKVTGQCDILPKKEEETKEN
jgi:hypothetical protein